MELKEFQRAQRLKAAAFMKRQHIQLCNEEGDHPDEVDTAYSLAADALRRYAREAADG